jgi:diphthamide synthase (EF-2-diphthine--ammonia ligase)
MKFIIVIKGTTVPEYELIRQDIADQLKAMGMPPFLFARLSADYTEIEVVWIDEDMEKEQYSEALKEGLKSLPSVRAN